MHRWLYHFDYQLSSLLLSILDNFGDAILSVDAQVAHPFDEQLSSLLLSILDHMDMALEDHDNHEDNIDDNNDDDKNDANDDEYVGDAILSVDAQVAQPFHDYQET